MGRAAMPLSEGRPQHRHDHGEVPGAGGFAAMTTVYRLVADDAEEAWEAWYELGLYAEKADAEADRTAVEAAYPGRPYWVEFRVDSLTVAHGRRTAEELAHALIALADRSEIDTTWTDPKAPDSYLTEHGAPRPVR